MSKLCKIVAGVSVFTTLGALFFGGFQYGRIQRLEQDLNFVGQKFVEKSLELEVYRGIVDVQEGILDSYKHFFDLKDGVFDSLDNETEYNS